MQNIDVFPHVALSHLNSFKKTKKTCNLGAIAFDVFFEVGLYALKQEVQRTEFQRCSSNHENSDNAAINHDEK